jgi:hypothetical protein
MFVLFLLFNLTFYSHITVIIRTWAYGPGPIKLLYGLGTYGLGMNSYYTDLVIRTYSYGRIHTDLVT